MRGGGVHLTIFSFAKGKQGAIYWIVSFFCSYLFKLVNQIQLGKFLDMMSSEQPVYLINLAKMLRH